MRLKNVFVGVSSRSGWICTWRFRTDIGDFREEQQPALWVTQGVPFKVAVEHYGLEHEEPSLKVVAYLADERGVERPEIPVVMRRHVGVSP